MKPRNSVLPSPVVLTLPVPPSPNKWASHPQVRHREKRRYQRAAWIAAVQQSRPQSNPPAVVHVTAMLGLMKLRDEDNSYASAKWALDALRQNQKGDLGWRERISETWGYFIDDDPGHMSLTLQQTKVAKKGEEFLRLSIYDESLGTRRAG